jgi:hypothetical protein
VNASRAALLLCLASAALAAPGCGKKGPPLAPLNRVPGRITDVTARRTGNAVTITFTVPSANLDDTKPADIARVEVYAYTALAQNDVRDVRRMTLIATIPVRKPPEPEEQPRQGGKQKGETSRKTKPAPKPEPGEDQGALVTVTETLTPDMQTPLAPDVKPVKRPPAAPESIFGAEWVPPLVGPPPQQEPRRFYLVYGANHAGNRGPASPRPPVPLSPPPPSPAQPQVEVTENGVVLTWETPAGAPLPIQEPATGDTLKATQRGMESAPPLSYLVYLDEPAGPAAAKVAPGAAAKGPVRLTEKPVAARSWTDTGFEFGVKKCYDVRAARVQGAAVVESGPSPIACVTPADTFPPPAPKSLAAVAGEGAVSLIWEGVEAADLAGYIVLRGEAPDGPLAPLFAAPIRETTYRDATAKSGVRYVYAVVALDQAVPPNRSELSNKVEETAR